MASGPSVDERRADRGRGARAGRPLFSRGPVIRTLEIVNGLVLLVVAGLVVAAIVAFSNQQDRTRALAAQAHTLAVAFQQQRLNNVKTGCQDQNAKHDATIKALRAQLKPAATSKTGLLYVRLFQSAGVSLSSVQRARLVGFAQRALSANSGGSITLINALVPRQDCAKLVAAAQRTGTVPLQTVGPPSASAR